MTNVTTSERVLAELNNEEGRTAGEIAEATSLGQSTVAKALVALEHESRVRRIAGGRDGGRRVADRWLIAAEKEPPSRRARVATEATGAEGGNPRLGRGELRGRVLGALRAATEPIGASGIAASLGHSSGAIANALERLVETAQAERVGEAPKRYRALDDGAEAVAV